MTNLRTDLRLARFSPSSSSFLASLGVLACVSSVTFGCADRGTMALVGSTAQGPVVPGQGGGSGGTDSASGGEGPDADPVVDVGSWAEEGSTIEHRSCEKIDFLFIIDNSGSMIEEQTALIASFPHFMTTVQTATNVDDFHVMVADTDSWCDPDVKATYKGDCRNPVGRNCDEMLGAGLLTDGTGRSCGVVGGQRFMTSAQPDLGAAFSCLGAVGTHGSADERPAQVLVQAVTSMSAPGACNDGFLRDDALLVVVFITDENDDHEAEAGTACPGLAPLAGSEGTPQSWYDAVVHAKGGGREKVVVLSLVGPAGAQACPGAAGCSSQPNGAATATTLLDFTARFVENGFVGPVCSHNYVPFFDQAVKTVTDACTRIDIPR